MTVHAPNSKNISIKPSIKDHHLPLQWLMVDDFIRELPKMHTPLYVCTVPSISILMNQALTSGVVPVRLSPQFGFYYSLCDCASTRIPTQAQALKRTKGYRKECCCCMVTPSPQIRVSGHWKSRSLQIS